MVSEKISRSGKGIVLFSKALRAERLRSRFREVPYDGSVGFLNVFAANIFFGDLSACRAARLTTVQPVCAMSCSQGYPAAAGLVCKNIFPPQRECFHLKKDSTAAGMSGFHKDSDATGTFSFQKEFPAAGRGMSCFLKIPARECQPVPGSSPRRLHSPDDKQNLF